jgi:steroid delta-isomerase-like uncharacterized protein
MTLRESREQTVAAHVAAENAHDILATLRSFHRPAYTVIPFGADFVGGEAVAQLIGGLMAGFPDFHAEVLKLRHSDDAVIAEIRMTGTQTGPWAGMPPSGKSMDVPTCCIFEFDGDKLVNEKVYFDNATMMRQLGA